MLHRKFFIMKPNFTPDKIQSTNYKAFQMDLKHMPTSPQGYKYILVLVSLTTREVDAVPLRTKTMEEVTRALKEMMKRKYIRSIGKMKYIGVDKGSEFLNKVMKEFLKSKNIELIPENTTIHINSTAIVERMIGTITKNVFIHMTQQQYANNSNSNDWVPILEDIVHQTNNKRRLRAVLKPQELLQRKPLIPANVIPLGTKVFVFLTTPIKPTGESKFKFRNGDLRYNPSNSGIVTHYLLRPGRPIRFFLDNNFNISYNRHELLAEYELY